MSVSQLQNRLFKLSEQRSHLLTSMSKLVALGIENDEVRKRTYSQLESQCAELDADISLIRKLAHKMGETLAEQQAEESRTATTTAVRSAVIETVGAFTGTPVNASEQRKAKAHAAFRALAFNKLEEYRALTTQTDGVVNGSSLVPQLYAEAITRAAAYVSPVVNLVRRIDQTAGRPYKIPVGDGTAQTMTLVSETAGTLAGQDAAVFSEVTQNTDAVILKQYVSLQQLEDSSNTEDFIRVNVGEAIARAVSSGILLGKDSNGNVLPNQPTGGLIAAAPVSGVTAAAGIASFADLTTLYSSVNQEYANRGSFLVSVAQYAKMIAQVDSTGRPLYKTGPDGYLLVQGKSVYPATELSSVAGGVVALFGDFSKAYAYIQGSTNVQFVYESPSIDSLVIETIGSHRYAGAALVRNAVKSLAMHS